MNNAGWRIDSTTLLPVIDDEPAFRKAHADDPACDALVALWTGHPFIAEQLIQQLISGANTLRFRALRADAWRDQGRHDEAIGAYQELVAEATGTALEATMRQHLGKVYFVAGETKRAHTEFLWALTMRQLGNAHTELVASSQLAVNRAAALLEQAVITD